MTEATESTGGDRSYRARLGEVLQRRDPDALRDFLIDQARTFGDDAQVQAILAQSEAELELLMHQMILARPDLGSLHAASHAALGMKSAPRSPGSGSPRRRR